MYCNDGCSEARTGVSIVTPSYAVKEPWRGSVPAKLAARHHMGKSWGKRDFVMVVVCFVLFVRNYSTLHRRRHRAGS